MAKEEKKKEEKEVKSAVYRVSLHCPKCAHDIRKPLLRTPGVENVDVKFEKNEITVKGIIDEKKIHKRMEKLSRRNVEIIRPPAPPKPKEAPEKEKVVKQNKVTVMKTTIKVFFHCNKCERDLRTKLEKKNGIHNVKTDMKAQTIVIEGTVEPKKLLTYMKRVHKHAEIVPPKEEKEEKKEKEKEKEKEKNEENKEREKKEENKEKDKEKKEENKEKEKKEEKEKEKEKVAGKTSTEIAKIIEFKEETKVEAKIGDGNVPYFIHYVYAPQMFSDENPNACSIM